MLNNIEEAIHHIKTGGLVIVVDDEDRENEGDFICAAEMVTPEVINFMATHGRGLICTPVTESRADALNLWPMVPNNTSMHETAFTVSIDYLMDGCTTGISAYDRATGIRAMTKGDTQPDHYARPGHIFPLRAKEGGVLRRAGHTEAAIDLARLAGFYPAGVLVEILNPDGSLARLPQLMELSSQFELPIISIKDLVAYRLETENLVNAVFSSDLNWEGYCDMKIYVFEQITTGDQHIAITKGRWERDDEVAVRVQSSTGLDNLERFFAHEDNFALSVILDKLHEVGRGALIIMRHEEKIKDAVHSIQSLLRVQSGKVDDKVDSGFMKDVGIGAQIIRQLGIRKMQLLTNSNYDTSILDGYGLQVVGRIGY